MARIKSAVEKAKLVKELAQVPILDLMECTPLHDNIQYTCTKVVAVEEHVLKDNLVIAQNKEDIRSTLFQKLRAKVLKQLRENNWNSVAVTAPTPGAGASLVTVNLAMSIAEEANQSVLVVDLDLRNPSIHHFFDIEPDYGVQDFLENNVGVEKILVNPGVNKLVLMPAKERILNSSEKLSSPKLKNLAKELQRWYDSRIIIYDLPPLLVSDDVMVFLPCVDCSLLVVASGVNTREEVEESVRLLDGKPLLGTVFNKDKDMPRLYNY